MRQRPAPHARTLLAVLAAAALAWSFWRDGGWLRLCAGLALFLFGMQCLEQGVRDLAGSQLERRLARSTGTPLRGLAFGIGATVLLQSSTLVSLLTIAFISSGLIGLAGGLAVIFGANLGATSGIWLLALAGHGFSLAPLALPLLVFGVLAGFTGPRGKAGGRVALGVAFLFLGIDDIKAGFEAFGGGIDMATAGRGAGTPAFVAVGLAATVVLQSSHATLMLTLTALAAGQLTPDQALAVAIGANVGSSVTTGVVGALGGNRSGQRLALAHVLFNTVTAALALALLAPLAWLVRTVAGAAGFGGNALLQLALFHTLFNAAGVALFWPWQRQLAAWLLRWLPDRPEAPAPARAGDLPRVHACHLSEQALQSADAAAAAVALELRHLGRRSLDVICQALYLPPALLAEPAPDPAQLAARPADDAPDAEQLYQREIKGVYGDLLRFMGRLDLSLDEEHQRFWTQSQMAALGLVDAVKDAKHLQKNLGARLRAPDSPLREAYLALRRHLFGLLHELRALGPRLADDAGRQARLQALEQQAAAFDAAMRQSLFAMVRRGELDGLQTGSLMNDLGYAGRIQRSLHAVLALAEEPASLRLLRRLAQAGPPAGA
ncbi:Na/Pi cotransporter family protein [Pseudorhodoferax sp.]|uniref:Na/Pi cotransporter family protein n=1 Tax=Pseudorhodoferax sp. TaxID=1993553 RepID=UPI0039E3EC5A